LFVVFWVSLHVSLAVWQCRAVPPQQAPAPPEPGPPPLEPQALEPLDGLQPSAASEAFCTPAKLSSWEAEERKMLKPYDSKQRNTSSIREAKPWMVARRPSYILQNDNIPQRRLTSTHSSKAMPAPDGRCQQQHEADKNVGVLWLVWSGHLAKYGNIYLREAGGCEQK
jgi:hypothetical protein